MRISHTPELSCLASLLAVLAWAGACTRSNPAYCATAADCADPGLPVCDPVTHACVPGVDGEEASQDADGGEDGQDSEDGADETPSEEQVDEGGDEARVGLFVDAQACPGSGSGSEADPFCTIQEALEVASPGQTIWIAAGTYAEGLSLAMDLTLVGEPGTVLSAPSCPVVAVMGGARVELRSLELNSAGSGANGLLQVVGSATLTAQDLHLGPSSCVGLRCSQATCTLDRANVQGNAAGGLDLGQTLYDVTNTFVVENGSTGQVGGARLDQPQAGSRFAFNTLAFNQTQGMSGAGLTCQTAAVADSCILWENVGGDISVNCTLNNSDVSQDPGSYTGAGNQNADPLFLDEGGRDLHLAPGSPCINAGSPTPASAPDHDYDGELRPQGGHMDQGADEAG
jgi:hypothetical protein